MKKILSVLLAGAMAAAVAGCTSSTPPAASTPEAAAPADSSAADAPKAESQKSGKQLEVDIFQFKTEKFREELENIAVYYTESVEPNVKVNITTVGGGSDYGAALRSQFASGDEPDIYNIGGPQDALDWKDNLLDITDTKLAKEALPGTLDGVTLDGQILGAPYNMEGYGLIYNKKIFEAAGIQAEEIVSWDAMVKAAELLDSKKAELGLEAVTAYPVKETWVTGLHSLNAFIAPEFDGKPADVFTAKTVDFQYADSFKQYVDFQNKYSAQPTASMDLATQVEKLFCGGKVAMIQQGNWTFGQIEKMDADFAHNDIGLLPFPVPGVVEDAYPVGVPMYWCFNKNSDAETQAASIAFMEWLNLSDAGKDFIVNKVNFIPAYKGFEDMTLTNPLGTYLLDAAGKGKTTNWVFMAFPTDWGQGVVGSSLQLYVTGEKDWDALINEAKDAWAKSRA